MKRTVFIGSVRSSKLALEALLECNIRPELVCSLDEEVSANVSDYYPLHEIAEGHGLRFLKFRKINDAQVLSQIREAKPDLIFIVGLSQIVTSEIIRSAKEYVIGFHPTPLPRFRGRAAVPWQILLGVKESAISFFKIDEGMDTGDIICQYPYRIGEKDDAGDVHESVFAAMQAALRKYIPRIYADDIEFIRQREEDATYLLTRRPEDGKIRWDRPGEEVLRLIRAVSRPYPGAFAFYKGRKVLFWRARLEANTKYFGIPGQLARIGEEKELAIVLKDSILVVTDYEAEEGTPRFTAGHKFE